MLISGAVFTINDTAMKWLRADYPVGELGTIRGIFSLIVLACLIRFIGGWHTLRIRDWRAQWLRSLLVLITTVWIDVGVTEPSVCCVYLMVTCVLPSGRSHHSVPSLRTSVSLCPSLVAMRCVSGMHEEVSSDA